MAKTFTITCYDKTKHHRKRMTKKVEANILCGDGNKAECYSNIYQDLIAGEKEYMDTEHHLTLEFETMLVNLFAPEKQQLDYIIKSLLNTIG